MLCSTGLESASMTKTLNIKADRRSKSVRTKCDAGINCSCVGMSRMANQLNLINLSGTRVFRSWSPFNTINMAKTIKVLVQYQEKKPIWLDLTKKQIIKQMALHGEKFKILEYGSMSQTNIADEN